MQFGTKIQENCKKPVLDCLFTRDNKIIRLGGTIYRKATHTDRFTRTYVIVQPDLPQGYNYTDFDETRAISLRLA